uniref:P2X purinoceptor n=1 Tax=Amphiprion percula TaxID=161767 RepID=A0A3P8RU35_AMPPE
MCKTTGYQDCLHYVFDYETPKTLVIPSIRVGCVFRFTQLLVVLYVVGYVCVVQKAYQDTDSVISTVTTKVKGFAFTNTSDMGPHLWDVAEYVIPPQGDHSFFVLTNMVVTPEQTQSRCPELPNPSTTCVDDCDCIEGHSDPRGNGIQTGLCENYSTTVKTCEVLSWCPHEVDTKLPERNILPHINSSYLKRCEFNRTSDPDCPIFRLKHIVSEAGEDFQDMAVKGGILGILIDWSCDLDWWAKKCYPKYSFRRLDNKHPVNNLAPGYNFRFLMISKKCFLCIDNSVWFLQAGKFGIVPTIVNLGAALSFLSLVSRNIESCIQKRNNACNLSVLYICPQVPVVTDWFMLTCMKKRDFYSKQKVSYLTEDTESVSDFSFTFSSYILHC